MALPQFSSNQAQVGRNLCEKHFPEPIIMFVDKERSLCKKCVPEYIESNIRERRSQLPQGDSNAIDARMAGIKTMALNAYQTEKTQISRSLDNI